MRALHQMESGHDLAPKHFSPTLCGSPLPSHSSAPPAAHSPAVSLLCSLILFLAALKPSASSPSSRKFYYCLNQSSHISWHGIFSHFYLPNKRLSNSFFMASPSFTTVTMTSNAVLSCFISSLLGFCARVIMKTLHYVSPGLILEKSHCNVNVIQGFLFRSSLSSSI